MQQKPKLPSRIFGVHTPNFPLKRYLLFKWGELGGPNGGWDDFIDSFDTLQQAIIGRDTIYTMLENSQIVDSQTGEIYEG